jgi:WD40 repeat protein
MADPQSESTVKWGTTVYVDTPPGYATNIRWGPGTSYGTYRRIPRGTPVQLSGITRNGWLQLTDGTWIAGNIVSSVPVEGGNPASPAHGILRDFSASGEALAILSDQNTVQVWSLESENLPISLRHNAPVIDLALSKNGKTIVTITKDQVQLWDIKGVEAISSLLKLPAIPTRGVVNVPEGKALNIREVPGKNYDTVGQLVNGSVVRLTGLIQGTWLQLSNGNWVDGNHITYSLNDSLINSYLTLSPDGKNIAVAYPDGALKLFDRKGEERKFLKDKSDPVTGLLFSPDGKNIVITGSSGTIKLWGLRGNRLQTLKGHKTPITSVTFSPSGKIIATADSGGAVKLWNKKGEELQTLQGRYSMITNVAFSPDEEIIATASSDNMVELWNLQLNDLILQGCNWLDNYFVKQSPELLMELNACQEANPSVKTLAAPLLVTKGEDLASQGNIRQATQLFKQAVNWDNRIKIRPRTRAQDIAKAKRLMDEGEDLVSSGRLSEASINFRRAQELDPGLDFNEDVIMLQRSLRQIGFLPPNFLSTGIYDEITQAAAREFQRVNGLPVTGTVDAATWNALFLAKAPTPQPSPSPSPGPTQPPSGSHQLRVVTDGESTSVFEGPGSEFTLIRTLANGTVVETTNRTSGNWTELAEGGWVFSLWLEPIQ